MNTREIDDLKDDPRLTAYALGELDESERAAVEELLERAPAARELVAEVRAAALLLESQLALEDAPALTAAQRALVEERAEGAQGPRRARTRRTWFALAAAASLLALVGLAAVSGLFRREARNQTGEPRAESDLARFDGRADYAPKTTRSLEELRDLGYTGEDGRDRGGGRVSNLDALATTDAKDPSGVAGRPAPPATAARRLDARRPADGSYAEDFDVELEFEALDRYEHNTEAYDRIVENAFRLVREEPLSTFSVDVDTASYANVRRYLAGGSLPPKDAVRIEELVNYFPYDYAGPTGDAPFAAHVEVAGCPWRPQHRLVRIGLKGREIGQEGRKPSNLVFLIDVSGSMDDPRKLPLLKRAMKLLVQELAERDRVAIVVYAGAAGLVLPSTPATEKWAILDALERLDAGGSTAGGAGVRLAYEVARESFLSGGTNRVLLATDGDFNVGVSDDGSLVRLVEEKRETGVFLSVLGFGTGNLKDAKLEKLADHGNGSYAYIDSLLEAQKVLIDQMGSTLETIAKDVKIQVEFNPLQVEAYRLIGYENRLMAARDFNDDAKDAGEIGAGHTVTALYELVPAGMGLAVPGVDPLRYQTPAQPSSEAYSGELMTVKLRHKEPDGDVSRLTSFPVGDGGGHFFEASEDLRFATSVAAFGMMLRGSAYAGETTLQEVLEWTGRSLGDDLGGYRTQHLELVRKALALSTR